MEGSLKELNVRIMEIIVTLPIRGMKYPLEMNKLLVTDNAVLVKDPAENKISRRSLTRRENLKSMWRRVMKLLREVLHGKLNV